MTTLLRNLTPMTPPSCGFDYLPSTMDITQAADLARIKFYRNHLAHLDDGKVDNTFFNTAWDDITSAIERLGGQQMKQECIHMKTKTLDQTNQEIMRDIKHSNDEIRELKESIESLKRSHEIVTKEMAEIKFSQKDTVPWNIRAQHNLEIKEWEKDETTFLETRATHHIITSISSNDCIIVTGSSGCGKSSNIHHAALHLRDNYGYEILPVLTGPTDIITYNNENKNQVFVVDDICGKESINVQTLRNWRDNAERMEKIFKIVKNEDVNEFVAESKLLISCRLHIYKESQFQLVKLLTRKECNLLTPELCLLRKEKNSMAKKYLPENIIDNVMNVEKNIDFFPLLCKLSKDKTSEEVISLFTSPVDSITENINHIVLESKLQFCALVLCLLYEDGFDTDWLKLKSHSENYKLENIIKEFEIDLSIETSRNTLKLGFSTLNGTYLKRRGTEYRMIHDKIYEMAAVICGQQLTECFIKYSHPIFIRDHFIFGSVIHFQAKDNMVVISEDTEEVYLGRLLSDLKELIIVSTFHNKQLTHQLFLDKLISFFERNDEAIEILKMLDTRDCILNKGEKISRFFESTDLDIDMDCLSWPTSGICLRTTPLIESISGGYFHLVHFLIETVKCDVNKTDDRNKSPLYIASEAGKTDIVELLCENNASFSQCDMNGHSPLYAACERGHTQTVNLLLSNQADVSNCKTNDTCPLVVACDKKYIDIVKLLLQNKIDLYQRERNGWSVLECIQGHECTGNLTYNRMFYDNRLKDSPLYVACKGGCIEIVELLLQNNAEVSTCNSAGYIPLDAAFEGGYRDIIKLLLYNTANVSRCDSSRDFTSLLRACSVGYTDILELLLQIDDDDELQLPYLLYTACEKGQTEIVELLLKRNGNLSFCYNFEELHDDANAIGDTRLLNLMFENSLCSMDTIKEGYPLSVACAKGYTNTVNMLLQHNYDVSHCNNNGESPLYIACVSGHTDTAKLLLQNQADVSKCNSNGSSPLYAACAGGHTDTVILLLQNKSDVSQCNSSGESPLFVACERGFNGIVKLLIQNNSDIYKCNKSRESPLLVSCLRGLKDTVKLLIQNKADVLKCNSTGESPLYVACDVGYVDVAELLLQNNADVSQCNCSGESPLYVACVRRRTDIVELLLQNNASVFQCERYNGQTPLHVVCSRDSSPTLTGFLRAVMYGNQTVTNKDRTEIVKLLIERNADVNLCNKKGQTPLDIARKSEFIEIVKLLEESAEFKTSQ